MTRQSFAPLALLCCALLAATPAARAQTADGPWLVRLRAVNLAPANHDSSGLGIGINSKVLPDLNVTYFWTPNIATELVLTYPQEQNITSNGTRIGSLRHLPPVLSMQYHVTTLGPFKPYAGLGVNYTRFSAVTFDPAVDAALHPSIQKNSFGPSAQLGFDYALTKNLLVNFDVKKVRIRIDIKSSGTRVGQLSIDPWLVGAGIGWRF